MTTLPSGTVTFLLTDVQGSTRLTQKLGEAWPPLLSRHLELLREAVAAEGGVEFGTEGDALFAVFASAPRAVAAAAAMQRAMAAEAWPSDAEIRVRIGLHTGEGTLSGGSYVGLDIHRAARIAAAGHGGQVVVSATTRMLVESQLAAGIGLQDLGEFRLKDLSRPEHLSMLVIDGLPRDFPPLRTLDSVPNNLPTQLTTFLGREKELEETSTLLAGTRLLTLTGPGGTGKTRLSLQLAADATDQYPDGVYFVALGNLDQPELLLPAVAQALGVPDPGGRPLERLTEFLSGKHVLVVLDNVERLLDAAPDVAELLAGAPTLRVLATSRSPLRIYGEQEYPVPPLNLPDIAHLPDLMALSQYASVALFIERAAAVKPGFRVTTANAPAIAEICVRLDGLPLAIELAAARVRLLPPEAILTRLGHRLTLLAGGARNLPERQQTLRGAIDWSYELLDDADRRLFARFAIFAGGADLGAVEEVVLASWPDAVGPMPDGLDALASLVDKSLLRQEETPTGDPRFRLLETIREYAAERLDEMGERPELAERHAAHYLAMAEELGARVLGDEQAALLETYDREHDNLRAAMNFALAEDHGELALRMVAACWRFWQTRGYLPEGRDRVERALALPDAKAHPEARLRALDAAGGIAYWQADLSASRRWYEEERELAEQLGDERAVAEAIYNNSFTYSLSAVDQDVAAELALDALERFRALGDRGGEGRALWAVVNSKVFLNDPEPAMGLLEQAIPIFRELGDRFQLGWALYTQALVRNMADDREAARVSLDEALSIFRASNDLSGYALVLDSYAAMEWNHGDQDRAMRIAGAAAAIQDVAGIGLAQRNREVENFFPQDLVGEAPLAEAYAEGQRLSPDEAVRLALHEDEEQPPGAAGG